MIGGLNYPMYIVTASDGARRAGCLVGFAGQCSIDPARFMVWLSTKNFIPAVAKHTDQLAVHIPTPATDISERHQTYRHPIAALAGRVGRRSDGLAINRVEVTGA